MKCCIVTTINKKQKSNDCLTSNEIVLNYCVFYNSIQGCSHKYVPNEFLKGFDSALYYNYEIKHNDWQLYQASLHWMQLRDFVSHRRGGQLCEWYKILKKLIKSSNLNGSFILKYQWIQKVITHHYIWPRSQTKDIFILKNKENTLQWCDSRTDK